MLSHKTFECVVHIRNFRILLTTHLFQHTEPGKKLREKAQEKQGESAEEVVQGELGMSPTEHPVEPLEAGEFI